MQKDFIPSELIAEGLAYTVMGICIVFLILIIIMLVIKAMAFMSDSEKKKEAAPAPVSAMQPQSAPAEDSLELIAVITAAVAASMGTSAASIRVKSYKKLDGGAWNKAGRREVLENRF